MGFLIGVDIGGTFTDCVAIDDDGHRFHSKALSTHATSPVEGVVAGLTLLAEKIGLSGLEELLAGTDRLGHGTTIGTNLVVERKGAKVGLIATEGHGDALSMMRGNGRSAGIPIDQLFSVHATDKPRPLVPRNLTIEVPERISVDGKVLAPLDEDEARRGIALLLAEGVETIAVALMWGFRNPVHERRIRELVHEQAPELSVSLASEVSPRLGEYERTVATVINSYVGPASSRYLSHFASTLSDQGLSNPPFVMQANGGVVPIDAGMRLPLSTIGSGPAGGLAGTTIVAAAEGQADVIATDMGGTSFEVGLLIGGEPVVSSREILDQYAYHASRLDVRSIACGGGSIASIDEHSGTIRVGPASAGSDPGPACYGRGEEATVTDADVVLGLIDPQGFLDGRMPLDRDAARRAIDRLAKPLGLSVEQAAAGIVQINGHQAATLIRQRTVEQGLDPRDFVLYAFGGAGPVHAFAFAETLGVRRVMVPLGNGASTLSAFGIASGDIVRDFELDFVMRAPFEAAELGTALSRLRSAAGAQMSDLGFAAGEVQIEGTAMARYAEQLMHATALRLPDLIDAGACHDLERSFNAEYVRLYGEAALAAFATVEIFSLRVTARVRLKRASVMDAGPEGNGIREIGERRVFWPGTQDWTPTPVYDGLSIGPTVQVDGPALVQLPHTSISVMGGQTLRAASGGSLALEAGADQRHLVPVVVGEEAR